MSVAVVAYPLKVKPRYRGVSHAVAFCVTGAALLALIFSPQRGGAYFGGLVYGATLLLMFAISGGYHVITWSSKARRVMRRIDHSTIFLLIAGTTTGFWTIAPEPMRLTAQLWAMWAAALIGIGLMVFWTDMPRMPRAAAYVVVGFLSLPMVRVLPDYAGWPRTLWIIAGAGIYILGAAVYARRWPNPDPRTFGYHEVFHLMVILAAAIHFTIIVSSHWA